ncbi:upstream-binding factor 1-like protein 1 [Vespa mandarinia]|uniref:upstream-binding factor 1-like protein 1 n=1 Tax=Vespa mandarinia TaxID=7446 RepID=UPI00161CDAF5|nr:upstream-binding factor 1-like protein 1 [Vespa mandarinia]XP_035738720.1 upstream-binding factor 1-like protein 1 [Vespa mandarinia]
MAGFGRFVSHGSCSHFLNARSSLTSSCQFISTKTKKSLERDLFPDKPKRPLTPFFKYMKIMRPSIVNEFPEYKSAKIVKEISARWALEDPEYKFKLNKEYDTEYKEYMMKVIEYEKSITPEQREQYMLIKKMSDKKKEYKDVKLFAKPKKPPSAFILYMVSMMKTKNSTIKNKEYVKQLSIQWKAMNEQDKKQFMNQAVKLMDQYNKEKEEWNQKITKEIQNKDKNI